MTRRSVAGKMQKKRFQLLAMSGSLRRDSASSAVLRTVAERLPADTDMTIIPLGHLPHYNEDEDRAESLRDIEAFRSIAEAADGLVVISPEYNHSISGVLKNAIDLISRPGYDSVLKNKPVLVMTTSNSPLGGVRAQMHLRELFASTLSRVVARRQIVIGQAQKKIVDGKLADEAVLAFIADGIGDLLDEIDLVRRISDIEPRGSLMRPRKPMPADEQV